MGTGVRPEPLAPALAPGAINVSPFSPAMMAQPSVATSPSAALVPFGGQQLAVAVQDRPTPRSKPRSPIEERRRYLQDQAQRILSKGGSQADVVEFWKREGVDVAKHFMVPEANVPRVSIPTPQQEGAASTRLGFPVDDSLLPMSGAGASFRQPQSDTPYALGLSLALLEGVTFGWGDEAIGSIVGLVTGEGAQAGRDAYREKYRAFAAENPKAAAAAMLAGGIGSALAMPAAGAARLLGGASKLGTLGRIGASAIEGAGAGAIAGAGAAEGGLSDRARGALFGSLVGGALGGGGAAAVKLLGAGPAASGFAGAALGTIAGGPAGAAVGGATGALAGKAGQAIVQRAGVTLDKVASRAPAAFAEKFFRAIDPSEGSPSLRARQGMRESLERDGLTIDAAIRKAEELDALGVPVTAADIGGDNTFAFVSEAAKYRSPETQALAEQLVTKHGKQGERLLTTLFDRFRLGTANAYDAGEELVRQRLVKSKPLYDQANQLEVQLTPEIRKVLNSPRFRSLYDDARAIAMEEDAAGLQRGLPVPPLQIVREPMPGVRVVFEANGVARPAPPGLRAGDIANTTIPVRGLDLLKRAIDRRVRQSGTLGGGPADKDVLDRQLGTAINEQLQQMLDHVGVQVPVYGQARQTYQAGSVLLDALALGKGGTRPYTTSKKPTAKPPRSTGPRFTEKPFQVIERELSRIQTPHEKAAYRLGALQDLAELIAAKGNQADVASDVFGTPAMESRIRALFDDPLSPEADQVFDAVRGELTVVSRSGRVARPHRMPSVPLREAEGAQPVTSGVGFLYGPLNAVLRRIGSSDRQAHVEAVSNEVSSLAVRGVNGIDELRGLLESLRNVGVSHSPVVPVAVGNVGAQLLVQ